MRVLLDADVVMSAPVEAAGGVWRRGQGRVVSRERPECMWLSRNHPPQPKSAPPRSSATAPARKLAMTRKQSPAPVRVEPNVLANGLHADSRDLSPESAVGRTVPSSASHSGSRATTSAFAGSPDNSSKTLLKRTRTSASALRASGVHSGLPKGALPTCCSITVASSHQHYAKLPAEFARQASETWHPPARTGLPRPQAPRVPSTATVTSTSWDR